MSIAAQGRVRRTVRFAQMEASSSELQRDAVPRRERFRMTGKLEMPSCPNTQDWMCTMGTGPSARFQVIEEPRKPQPAISRAGVREDWARVILWVMAVVMCVTLLTTVAAIGSGRLRIQKLETRIDAAQAKQEALKRDLAALSGDISVCTRAVELNLISSNGARTIQLTAPEGATMTLVDSQETTGGNEPETRASRGRTE